MPDPLTIAATALLGAASGLLYGALWFAHKHEKNGEPLNKAKLGGTLLVAGGVGGALALSGEPVTQETWIAVFSKNLALVTLLEPMLKSAFRQAGVFENYAS